MEDVTGDIDKRMTMVKDGFSKFSGSPFRPHQEDAIRLIVEAKKRFCVVEAPTGQGKSIIGMVAGRMVGKATYLVRSRALQVQLNEDFPEIPLLWGKGNYPCIKYTDKMVMCDSCTHSKGNLCGYYKECKYTVAKKAALTSSLRVLNYDYFLTEANYVGQFSNNDIVIVDEADSLEDTLVNHIKIDISDRLCKNLWIAKPHRKTTSAKDGVSNWKGWAGDAYYQTKLRRDSLGGEIAMYNNITSQDQVDKIKRYNMLNGMLNRLNMFIKYVDKNWIYEETNHPNRGGGISFRPTWISEEIADDFMWGHGNRFVLMSATFHKPLILAKLLGIPHDEIEFHSFPSTFPVESREVSVEPVANLTFKTMDEEVPKLMDEIRRILALHPNEKGMIHCVSHGLAKKILDIGDPRLMSHSSSDKIEQLRAFKNSPDPMVMVSPSSERGISLDDDYCRFIIWAKAPYLNLKDKLVQTRVYGDKGIGQHWYVSHMLLSVVQGCGRGTRSKEDYCKSYLIDQQISNAITRSPRVLPDWFRDACW